MKNKFTRVWIYSIVLTLFVGFSSCSKDKDEPAPDPTSILTSNVWVVDDYDVQSGDLASQLIASMLIIGEPQDFEFKTNGDVDYTMLLSTETGKWSLSTDNKTLTIKDGEGEVVSSYEIVEAKAASIKWKRKFTKAELQATSDVSVLFTLLPE